MKTRLIFLLALLPFIFLFNGKVNAQCLGCPFYDYALTPTNAYQTYSGSIVAYGCTQYQIAVTAGTQYRFTFCDGGGTGSYDTYLTLRDNACTTVAYNDDNCGNLSQINYTATYTGNVYLAVSGYSSYFGTYTLAYKALGPCDFITTISGCDVGNAVTSSLSGSGYGWNISSCGFATYGQEKIFQYTPVLSGVYSLQVTAASGGYIDYFYKDAALGCDELNWTCIDNISATGIYGSFNLTAGVTYYFLLDAEDVAAVSQTFYIPCLPRPCVSCVPEDVALGTIGETVYGYSVTGNMGNEGKWSGSFNGQAGRVYHFDLCPTAPGAGTNNLDIDIKITDASCNILTGADGYCISPTYAPNDFQWTCPANGTYYVILAPYASYESHTCDGTALNTFTMQYYKEAFSLPSCPVGAQVEGEPDCYDGYIDNFNGGCNSSPAVFSILANNCEQTACGKSGSYLFDGSTSKDTDWWQFTATATTTVFVDAIAEFGITLGLVDGTTGCPVSSFATFTTAIAGDSAHISYTVGPGNWWIWVGPSSWDALACGSDYQFHFWTVTDPPVPVVADDPACSATVLNVIPTSGTTNYMWQGNSCGTSVLAPATNPYPVTASGDYYVRGYNSGTGCWSANCTNLYVPIIEPPVPTAFADGSAAGVTVCESTSVLLTGSCASPTNDVLYRWLKGNQEIRTWSTDSAFTLTSPQDTIYTLETKYNYSPPSVLILYAEDNDAGIVAYLSADTRIGTVTGIDVRSYTPTLAELQSYDVVITWSDYNYADAVTIGNVFKDYVDGGGKLITLHAATLSDWGIKGNYLSSAYSPIEQSTSYNSDNTFIGTISIPGHPILNGVTDINPVWHHYTSTLTANAQPIFYWADGYLGAAYKDFPSTGKIVALNFLPNYDAGTDGNLLILNSVVWLVPENTCIGTDDVTVNVIPLPAAPTPVTATPSSICVGDYSDLNAISIGDSINWWNSSLGGTSYGTSFSGDNFAVNPDSTTTYYAEAVSVPTPSGSLTFNYTGSLQTFTVPAGVTSVNINALGAQGGSVSISCSATGGLGAKMEGTFAVTPGEVLSILVGQQGNTNGEDAGGGGGTYVVRTGNVPLIVAGGGGGATNNIGSCGSNRDGVNATITTSGTTSGDGLVTGGTSGNGGGANFGSGGGGGGFYTDGVAGSGFANNNGKSYLNGGGGGSGNDNDGGGYGGGGAGWFTGGNGGGGGGYSGGGTSGGQPFSGGGGGGSYNIGADQVNTDGFQLGDGQVTISWTGIPACASATRTPVTVTVNTVPDAAGTITGTTPVCAGTDSVAYSVLAIAGATSYIWSYTGTGATINGTGDAISLLISPALQPAVH